MVAKTFEIGDLVWAKMKGYPFWPGKIIEPRVPSKTSKTNKPQHYVLFFGSENHAWIPDDYILLHNTNLVKEYANQKKRPPVYLLAVEEIVALSKNIAKYQEQSESSVLSSKEESSKSPHVNSVSKKNEIKKKDKKAVGNNTIKHESPKKRKLSSSQDDKESDDYQRSKMLAEDVDFTDLMSNIPPNISYESVQPTSKFDKIQYIQLPPPQEFDFTQKNKNLANKNIIATSKKIGFLGLGTIGRGIVRNLLQTGHDVTIWDLTPERASPFSETGATIVDTPSDVVSKSDITFSCVSGSDAAKTFFFESLGSIKGFENCEKGKKGYVEMTSVDPATSQSISEAIASKGGLYLEAQFIGSIKDAEDGQLVILCAGDNSLFDECKSCFEAISKKAMFLGPKVGDASNTNIIYTMLLGNIYAAVAESLALSERVGLKVNDVLEIFQLGSLDSKLIIEKGQCMINKKYDPKTPLKHIQKNIQCGMNLGSKYVQPMPVSSAANQFYMHCMCLRYGDHDVSAIYEGTQR